MTAICVREVKTPDVITKVFQFPTKKQASEFIKQQQALIPNYPTRVIKLSQPTKGLTTKFWYVKREVMDDSIPF